MSSVDLRLADVERQYHRQRRWLLLVIAVGFVVNVWFYFLATGPEHPGPTLLSFTNFTVNGPTALCPGDVLDYTLDIEVTGPGVFSADAAVWRVTPPQTVIFSHSRRAVISEPVVFVAQRSWRIPAQYDDPVTGELVDWPPGHYERRHAVSTISRSTEPSIIAIPFEIREDCP